MGVPSDPTARDILDFALSDEAQPTVQDAEFVDQAVDFQDDDAQRRWAETETGNPSRNLPAGKAVPGAAVNDFSRAMTRTHRTTLVFRFEKGSAQLDNRALQDVARLARYLSNPAQAGKRYFVVGFADSSGSWGANSHLASYFVVGFADSSGSWGANSHLASERSVLSLPNCRDPASMCRARASYRFPTWRPSRATTPTRARRRTGVWKSGSPR